MWTQSELLLGNSEDEDLGEDSGELARRENSKAFKSFGALYQIRQFVGSKRFRFKDRLTVVCEFCLSVEDPIQRMSR